MQEKPDDKFTVPLCPYHHRIGADCQHNSNETEWWALRGINPFAIAADLWKRSGGEERAAQPRPVKKPRRIRPRSAPDRRTKIQGNRTIQGRSTFQQSRGFEKRRQPEVRS